MLEFPSLNLPSLWMTQKHANMWAELANGCVGCVP